MSCDEVKLWKNANFEDPYAEKALKQNANFEQLKKLKRKQAAEKDSASGSTLVNLVKLWTESVAEGIWIKIIY